MKTARLVLKIISASLCGVAGILAIIAYWDKLTGLFTRKPKDEWDDFAEEDICF